ncbi:hypothetical protein [Glycomyces tarimensis]
MSGWTVPPSAAVPPGVGTGPPPGVGLPYQPEDEADRVTAEQRATWAEADAEAARYRSSDELRREADRTRQQLSEDVVQLRERLGFGDEATAGGPFGSARRHPVTVVVAAAGATTATLIGLKVARAHRREHNKAAKHYMKAAKRRRRDARKRMGEAKDMIVSAASDLPHKRRTGLRRLTHR